MKNYAWSRVLQIWFDGLSAMRVEAGKCGFLAKGTDFEPAVVNGQTVYLRIPNLPKVK